jgi:adenosyl cobinamide kinase/adenosyl cobinamide phosphate guanylyltransferase
MDDNDSELDYVSSVDPFTPEKDDPSVDAPDEKALVRVQRVLAQQKKRYETIEGMKQFDKKFSADQREELCNQMVTLIDSLSKTVNNAIDNIKEKAK